MKDEQDLSFEQSLKKLEGIVEQLASGSANLEEMVQLYEQGIVYLNHCRDKLEQVETKIRTVSQGINQAKEEENGL
ncbi:MAG: exodeoxyribonuclease VII small subunit [Candidatus Cloacimonetes bacterium]|nr:exodeoxyribonuclease VII small subunit [Candidatus Cloacimonadota bacterium]